MIIEVKDNLEKSILIDQQSKKEKIIVNCYEGKKCKLILININSGQPVDIEIDLNNLGPNSECELIAKVLAKDDADCKITVNANIKKGNHGAVNIQSLETLVVGKIKKVEMNPNFYIDEADVNAKHKAKISYIDDEIKFYLESKGISKEKTKELIIQSFLCKKGEKC